jgi:hypothetical protein
MQLKEREMIEEEKRNAYTFAKDEREQAYKDEQERIRKEKEAAADKIRLAQESASGVHDALEDLRNQRIYVRPIKIYLYIHLYVLQLLNIKYSKYICFEQT